MTEIQSAIRLHEKGILNEPEFFVVLALYISTNQAPQIIDSLDLPLRETFLAWLSNASQPIYTVAGANMGTDESQRRKAAIVDTLALIDTWKQAQIRGPILAANPDPGTRADGARSQG